MFTAKTGQGLWNVMSHARYRYVPCSRPLCHLHARKPQRESPFAAWLLLGLSPLQLLESKKKKQGVEQIRSADGSNFNFC